MVSSARKLVLAAGLMVSVVASARAQVTITFDDLGSAAVPIPNGYNGFTWTNFYSLPGAADPGSGYDVGMISAPNVAFGLAGTSGFSLPSLFTLNNGWFTAAWNTTETLTVTGYNGVTQLFQQVDQINDKTPSLLTFDWAGVTDVTFTTSNGVPDQNQPGDGDQFALDNLKLDHPLSTVVPEPETMALMAFGLVGLSPVFRRKRRR